MLMVLEVFRIFTADDQKPLMRFSNPLGRAQCIQRRRSSNIYDHSASSVEAVSSPSLQQRNRAASSTQQGGKNVLAVPWKENVFASFVERMVRHRDVQEGEMHRSDTEMFGENTISSLDVGWLNGCESMTIVETVSPVPLRWRNRAALSSQEQRPNFLCVAPRSEDVGRTFLFRWKRRVS